jgi:ATP-dependent helicase HrpB
MRAEHEEPEIRRLDLTQTWLELKALGDGRSPALPEPGRNLLDALPWLEVPPEAHTRAAEDLLRKLGATDPQGRITDTGRAMARFAVHPRVSRVVVEAERRGVLDDGCVAAALLTEGDIRSASRAQFGEARGRDAATERSDVDALLDLYREAEDSRFSASALRAAGLDAGTTHTVARLASQLLKGTRRAAVETDGGTAETALGISLLAGYPDRVARRVRAGSRQVALAGGGMAELSEASVVREAKWLVALDAEERAASVGRRGGVVVHIASAIEPEWLIELFPEEVVERREVTWNAEAERVESREALIWGDLVMHESIAPAAPGAEASRQLARAALDAGPAAFAAEGALESWLARARFAASVDASTVAPSDDDVKAALVALCEGRRSFAELREAHLLDAVRARTANVDRLAPERVALAGGRGVAVRYEAGRPPSIASRLQDFFGMTDGPRIGGGRMPLVLELLAPNGRAVQVTTDLAGFWARHYPSVRKELMRRYPRHSWPDDPTVPTPRMRPRR